MTTRRTSRRKGLKKQTQLRRTEAATAVRRPRLAIPKKTARAAKRRRRSEWRIKWEWPRAFLWRVVTSARWVSLGLLALTVYALGIIGTDSRFYVTTIPISGVRSVVPQEIVAASGLAGSHVFAVNPAVAAENIDGVPGVVGAAVEISWPNKVQIEIMEDSPVAIWADADGAFWVNAEGQLIPARMEMGGLFRIEADSTQAVIGRTYDEVLEEKGEEVEGDTAVATLGAIPLDILEGALGLADLFPEQESIRYSDRNGLIYRDTRGWDVYLGTGEDMAQKLAVHESIVTTLNEQELTPEFVSVSNQEKPFFTAYEGAGQ